MSAALVVLVVFSLAGFRLCFPRLFSDIPPLGLRLRDGLAERGRPTLIDVVVTRDPGQMLPGVDNRSAPIRKGDRVA